jgi:hypothetical protein
MAAGFQETAGQSQQTFSEVTGAPPPCGVALSPLSFEVHVALEGFVSSERWPFEPTIALSQIGGNDSGGFCCPTADLVRPPRLMEPELWGEANPASIWSGGVLSYPTADSGRCACYLAAAESSQAMEFAAVPGHVNSLAGQGHALDTFGDSAPFQPASGLASECLGGVPAPTADDFNLWELPPGDRDQSIDEPWIDRDDPAAFVTLAAGISHRSGRRASFSP